MSVQQNMKDLLEMIIEPEPNNKRGPALVLLLQFIANDESRSLLIESNAVSTLMKVLNYEGTETKVLSNLITLSQDPQFLPQFHAKKAILKLLALVREKLSEPSIEENGKLIVSLALFTIGNLCQQLEGIEQLIVNEEMLVAIF